MNMSVFIVMPRYRVIQLMDIFEPGFKDKGGLSTSIEPNTSMPIDHQTRTMSFSSEHPLEKL